MQLLQNLLLLASLAFGVYSERIVGYVCDHPGSYECDTLMEQMIVCDSLGHWTMAADCAGTSGCKCAFPAGYPAPICGCI